MKTYLAKIKGFAVDVLQRQVTETDASKAGWADFQLLLQR